MRFFPQPFMNLARKAPCLIAAVLVAACLVLSGKDLAESEGEISTQTETPLDSPNPKWFALLQRRPFAYKPLPPAEASVLDGIYVKRDPKKEAPVPCRRCPDYAPEGGIWRLNLDKGIFRIFHDATGWRSIGSFLVEGDRLILFNDPCCHEVTGTYHWRLREGRFILEVIEDECAIRLRAANFARQPWLSCRPPSIEAAITDHWPKPDGCE
jgi:hypothetical protein